MKKISENAVKEESSRGKNEPLAKAPEVRTAQNGEVAPSKRAGAKQAAKSAPGR